MIQLALDASMVRLIPDEKAIGISLTIAGCSLVDEVGDSEIWSEERVKDSLLPWNWEKPKEILVVWLDENKAEIGKSILPLSQLPTLNTSDYFDKINSNENNYKDYYNTVILSGLHEKLIAEEITMPAIDNAGGGPITIQVTENPGDSTEAKTNVAGSKKFTGFLHGTIAQLAQRNPPVNQLLNLAFLAARPDSIPTGTSHFVAFPISTPNDGEQLTWEQDSNAFTTAQPDVFGLKYKRFADKNVVPLTDKDLTAYCFITPVPTPNAAGNNTIELRDEEGNFKGAVNIQISDTSDWLPALLKAEAPYFNLCAQMWGFVQKNTAGIKLPDESAEQDIFLTKLRNIDLFLWNTLHDVAGFGAGITSGTPTLPEKLAAFYCDEKIGLLSEITPAKCFEYWRKFDELRTGLSHACTEWEKDATKLNDETWHKIIEDCAIGASSILSAEDQNIFKNLIYALPAVINPAAPVEEQKSYELSIKKWWEDPKKSIAFWLEQWRRFLLLLQKTPLLEELVLAQYMELELEALGFKLEKLDSVKGENNKQRAWLRKAIANAGNVAEVHTEVIVWKQHETLLEGLNKDLDDVEVALSDFKKGLKLYAKERIQSGTGYYPELKADPFSVSLTDPAQLPLNWLNFLNYLEESVESDNATNTLPTGSFDKQLKLLVQKTSPVAPPLKFKIQDLLVAADPTEDLSDELAGHLVLMRRGAAINEAVTFGDWKYLNYAKVETAVDEKLNFENNFITPLFVPTPKEGRPAFLEISNEKRSLTAGENPYGFEDGKAKPPYQHYLLDEIHDADELWYGYYYQAAAFVALNSGVLPSAIALSLEFPNIPQTNPYLIKPESEKIAKHHYLRRVPVGAVRNQLVIPLQKMPEGLHPLAHELMEWIGNKEEKGPQKSDILPDQSNQIHYLLAENQLNNINVKEKNFQQQSITLELRKPDTSYYNWLAWMGKDADAPLPAYENRKLRDFVWEIDQQNRMANASVNGAKPIPICDPAAENFIVVRVEQLFPVKTDIRTFKIDLNPQAVKKDSPINDYINCLEIELSKEEAVSFREQNETQKAKLSIPKGHVVRIFIHAVVDAKHFNAGEEAKFYDWMADLTERGYPDPTAGTKSKYRLAKPTEIWFETAIKTKKYAPADKYPTLQNRLWELLRFKEENNGVLVSLERAADTSRALAYLSRTEIKHQVWHWNGQLTETEDLLRKPGDLKKLDPLPADCLKIEDTTTEAMIWEAWAFSDRPNFAALNYETRLLALREGDTGLITERPLRLFQDVRPNEEKALYYRFSIQAYSRYELLGPAYAAPITGEIPVQTFGSCSQRTVHTSWRRYLRLSTKTKALPRPSIRFVLPLTSSIDECKESSSIVTAPLLLVLDDHWFAEAGLAEKLHVGVEMLAGNDRKEPHTKRLYLNAGNDPILSGESLTAIKENPELPIPEGKNQMFIIDSKHVKGPVGLTFDAGAQTPKLKGCAFILELPDLSNKLEKADINAHITNQLQPWAMMQIAVRRTLREEFCAEETASKIPELTSFWTAKEWVQFLPSVDSFIPGSWRKEVFQNRYLSLNEGKTLDFTTKNSLPVLPVFDSHFEESMIRYYILTETVGDIGGQPSERYIGTYQVMDNKTGEAKFVSDGETTLKEPDFSAGATGYIRLMLVRKTLVDTNSPSANGEQQTTYLISPWKGLFGKDAFEEKPDFDAIENDPLLAMPMVSKRVPYKIAKKIPSTS